MLVNFPYIFTNLILCESIQGIIQFEKVIDVQRFLLFYFY